MENIRNHVISKVLNVGPGVIGAILVLWIGFKVVGKIDHLVEKNMHRGKTDQTVTKFVISLINIGLKTVLVITAAGMIGIETTSFIAILGAAGLAVGLALQGSLANFAGGVLILLFKPYKVGHYIQSQGEEGTVDEINIFNTKIITPENKVAIIPNGAVANGNIVNFTIQKTRRVDVLLGIAYNEDIDKTRKILETVLKDNVFVVDKPLGGVYVTELAASSVNLILRGFTKPKDYRNTFFSLTEEAKKALDKAGISIPFPQRVIRSVSENKDL